MLRSICKKTMAVLGLDTRDTIQKLGAWSIRLALAENGRRQMVEDLRRIVPDISNQESSVRRLFNDYWELKRRCLQAFQCSLMLKALQDFSAASLTVVDIGDSAGTHMLYLKALSADKFNIESISVNLDPQAIERIRARGLQAVHCRAEDLNLADREVDLFTSFQMVEHLHNPGLFFRRLARRGNGRRMLITVPYLQNSRVGLHHIRNNLKKPLSAEETHIFELSPQDWTLLLLHSGWRVTQSEIYYQYPRKNPFLRRILRPYWALTDFEGFWGAILEKDNSFSDCYQDWEV